MLFVTCEKKNNLRWSGRPWTGLMYPSRAILTLSLQRWKFFMHLIFDVVGHRRNIFNDENFPIYGSSSFTILLSTDSFVWILLTSLCCCNKDFYLVLNDKWNIHSITCIAWLWTQRQFIDVCEKFLLPMEVVPYPQLSYSGRESPWTLGISDLSS